MVELGCYGLAGHVDDPRVLLDEVRDAERIGLGSVFLSERFNVKEAATLCGAADSSTNESRRAPNADSEKLSTSIARSPHGSPVSLPQQSAISSKSMSIEAQDATSERSTSAANSITSRTRLRI